MNDHALSQSTINHLAGEVIYSPFIFARGSRNEAYGIGRLLKPSEDVARHLSGHLQPARHYAAFREGIGGREVFCKDHAA